ncbi:HsdM family class I SAM-dependent methyltransferase [Microvirga sp. M2]|uniref:HsdM family class I SAM-dependent methyltransferase n=1 Tax=Microvirga sp. M2 TaxID=3073270 RepID=UPI0039C0D327
MTSQFSLDWSRRFGLAHAPLFEIGEIESPDRHAVLLDGGNGSFALSQCDEAFDPRLAASWAWSAGLPHHVAVTEDKVFVTRWDTLQAPESFTYKSVSQKLDAFYSYLAQRRVSARRDVIATLLDLFRAVRGEIEVAGAADETAVAEFLDVLAELVASEQRTSDSRGNFAAVWNNVRNSVQGGSALSADQKQRLEVGFKHQVASLLDLQLSAALAVRHAASAIFQEAHFAFESSGQSDLFGHQPASTTKSITRGAHHFTPPSLARSIVEQSLAAIADVERRPELVVCDPACGSGAFLTETARTLRRIGFTGKLKLVGRDLSPSAVLMAKFALHAAKFDWQPAGGIEIDVEVADALNPDSLPRADLVVMNPPFLAWPMMNKLQRDKVSQILGSAAKHRPDLSMAFVSRALDAVGEGGVVASLMPSSILALDSGKEWRRDLLERARLAFLGSFGEYGLFVHALVQVAAMVLVAGDKQTTGLALRSANEQAATGEALRALRRLNHPVVANASGKGWRIAHIDKRDLLKTDRWRILPASVDDSLRRLDELGMPRVGDLFDVKQGLLTGLNDAFILSAQELQELPGPEKQFFRPALFRDAISEGVIRDRYFVFFPYNNEGLIFSSEEDVRNQVPVYFGRYLAQREHELKKRSGIDEVRRPWWSLSRYYSWVQATEARILTKYFGAIGDFAVDDSAKFVPLHGYVWFFNGRRKNTGQPLGFSLEQTLNAYHSLLNSRTFARLLKVYSDPVAGGQSNLSARFVRPIPLPDLTLYHVLVRATRRSVKAPEM